MAKQAMIIRNLEREKEAVANLLAHLGAMVDDSELVKDTIEGETDFFKVIDSAVVQIAMDESHVAALDSMIKTLQGRKSRKAMRIETTQAAILTALDIAGQERHEGPLATVSVAKTPAKVIVTDESTIKSDFFNTPEPPAPQLDKRKLLAYLKERHDAIAAAANVPDANRAEYLKMVDEQKPPIVGAEISNGGTRLNVRFK